MQTAWEKELFPVANKAEIQRSKFLLTKYKGMVMLMDDYERHTRELQQVAIDGEVARRIDADELHADKAANAVILMDKQRWVYDQYKIHTVAIRRAAGLILDSEARQAIECRYIDGYSFKETVLRCGGFSRQSTIRRQLTEGIESIANTLKLIGFFETDNSTF